MWCLDGVNVSGGGGGDFWKWDWSCEDSEERGYEHEVDEDSSGEKHNLELLRSVGDND